MPPVIIAAAVAGTAGLAGAAISSNATKKAAQASQDATNQSIAAQQAQYQQTRADNTPFMQTGYAANNALASRLNLTGSGSAGAGSNGLVTPYSPGSSTYLPGSSTPVSSGLTDAQAQQLLQARPDVMAEYQRASSVADKNSPAYAQAGLDSPQNYARHWYSQMGGDASYNPQGTTPQQGANPATVPAQPQTGGATANNYVPVGTYGNTANPTYTDPGTFSYGLNDYTASPAYQYTVDQAMKGVLANSAATGALQSGAALKALQDRGANLAYQDFSNERNFARASYDTNRAFGLQQYQDQRNYLTNRYDTETGSLFSLSNQGQSAASGTASAGANATGGIVNALQNNAANQGNSYLAGANSMTSLLGSGVNALAYNRGYGGAGGMGGFGTQGTMGTASPGVSSSMYGLY